MQKNVTFLDVSEVYAGLGFTDAMADHVDRVGFDRVTYGDADFTLVGNHFALDCILEGVFSYYDFLKTGDAGLREGHGPHPSDEELWTGTLMELGRPPASMWTEETLRAAYWQMVGKDDYINLEY